MKRSLLFSVSLFIIILLVLVVVFAAFSRTYVVSVPSPDSQYELVSLQFDDAVIDNTAAFEIDGKTYFIMSAVAPGISNVTVSFESEDAPGNGPEFTFPSLTVSNIGILYQESLAHDFQYWQLIFVAFGVYFLILGLWFYRRFSEQRLKNIYDYSAVFYLSLMIICTVLAILLLIYGVLLLTRFAEQTASGALSLLGVYIVIAVGITLPLMFIFFVAMTVSNVSLIKHEGFRLVNLLGSAVGLIVSSGIVACVAVTVRFFPEYKSDMVFKAVTNIAALALFFFESLLVSASVCSMICLRIKPPGVCDYIIILGCGFKKDGTLSTILKGRVDKAIEHFRALERSGIPLPSIIPSGGKGTDEIISESEAMTRYLLSKGFSRDQIIQETKSTTTFENMLCSKALIDERKPDASVVFSTTQYHVFRSGIYASKVGLKAVGIGSRTKWYFWPNAFMREVIGLLVAYWRKELVIGFISALFVILITNLQNILQAIS